MTHNAYKEDVHAWETNMTEWERRDRPADPLGKPPGPREPESGPRRPETDSPSRDNLLKRMRKVDPKQAERYRQRTGE